MNNIKKTLQTLLENELVIPEIQRDYVWGNNEIVLRRFLKNIFNNKEELDIGFFYSYKVYQNEEIYALIDGQQRITTLVLLYWYLGIGEDYIKKFKFKVRENCNNFLEKLLKENISNIEEEKKEETEDKKIEENISERIKNCIWYLSIWDNDPTVKSMLKALDIINDEFKEFNEITENKEDIKNNIENNIIFTCITNDDRGLEKEYISLNARGRELERYEKLKAILVEDMDNKKVEYMKDRNKWLEKWEKDWQDILWECKGDNVYNTDNIWNAVLYWARDIFVIENNIYKPNKEEDNNKKNDDNKKINFDFDLMSIKGNNDKGDNYKDILLKIFDWIIPALKIINKYKDLFQKKCQFNNNEKNKVIDIDKIIEIDSINNDKFTYSQRALFYGLLYLVKNKYDIKSVESINSIKKEDLTINKEDEILERIRVFRNLIQNSYVDSSNLKNVVESLKLLSEKTIYNFPNELLENKKIRGIDLEQKYEEALKLDIFKKYTKYKDTILKIENDTLFKGKIKDIFILLLLPTNETISKIGNYIDDNSGDLLKNEYENIIGVFDNSKIYKLFYIHKDINTKVDDVDDNSTIWWELLPYDFYNENENNISCIYYKNWNDLEYYKWKGKLILSFLWYISKQKEINDFQIYHQEIILKKIKSNIKKNKLNTIENIPKKYILYLLSKNEEFMNKFGEDKQFQIYLDKKGNLILRSYNLKPSKNDPYIVLKKTQVFYLLNELFL